MKKLYAFAAAAAVALAANAQTLYITGDGEFANGQWNAATPDQFEVVDGAYQIEVNNVKAFKISTAAGDWDAFNEGCYGCNYGEEPGVAVALETPWSDNINCPWKGDYKIVVAADLSTITLTTTTEKPEDQGAPDLFLRGSMNGWGADEAWQMTCLGGGVYKFVFGDDQAITAEDEWKIADADWNPINIGDAEAAIMLDTETQVHIAGNPANMKLEETCNGVIWLILDLDGETYLAASNDKTYEPDFAEYAEDDAVELVGADNATVTYFNLQGVRVANPSNGIYVKVVGQKASKVLFND